MCGDMWPHAWLCILELSWREASEKNNRHAEDVCACVCLAVATQSSWKAVEGQGRACVSVCVGREGARAREGGMGGMGYVWRSPSLAVCMA